MSTKLQIKTTWDLDNIFKTVAKNPKSAAKIFDQDCLKFINKWQDIEFKDVKTVGDFLRDYERFLLKHFSGGKFFIYIRLKYHLNLNDAGVLSEYKSAYSLINNRLTSVDKIVNKLAKIPKELQEKVLAFKNLQDYKYYLTQLFFRGQHMLSLDTEELISLLAPSLADNWMELTQSLLSKMRFRIKDKKSGKLKIIPFSGLYTLIRGSLKDAKYVDYIDSKYTTATRRVADVATWELNSLLHTEHTLATKRGFKDTLEERAIHDEISRKTIETLVRTVTDNFDISCKYYEILYRHFKRENIDVSFHYGLRNLLPITKGENIKMPYKNAVKILADFLEPLDKDAFNFFKQMINGRIDVYPKSGKESGAFMSSFRNVAPSFILLNWGDNLDDLFTLSHEFGHAFHSYMARNNKIFYRGYSTAVAEFASIFLETIVSEMYFKGKGKDKELYRKWQLASGDIASIFRQIALFNFEFDLYKAFKDKHFVSTKNISDLFKKHMTAYLGDAILFKNSHKLNWTTWPHIRYMFYVYTYASGSLAAYALASEFFNANSESKKREVFAKYKQVLSFGGSKSVEDIFLSIGFDITKPSFWQQGLNLVKDRVNALNE